MGLPNSKNMPKRLFQLYSGLLIYGVAAALLVRAKLGLDPWDVFHQGLSRQFGLAIGTWVIIVGIVVVLLWIPLKETPGLGTISNVAIIGLVMNFSLGVLPHPHSIILRWIFLGASIIFIGMATGMYIGAGLGPGPRDGLMTAISAKGYSLRVVRTCIEATALIAGWLLGGSVGIGTLIYALSIGPLSHIFIPIFDLTGKYTTAHKSRTWVLNGISSDPNKGLT